ncbi:MAG TPA: HAMP domain-containing sensor histidine kinase [Gaiellaceae bacterium]|jgi:signal transduction histidine kinase|nr:HAMP domain-containing sensor histidine kinase [Gaiellaceae bacterium]
MFRSLRFRLPALFLAGAALAGVVSTIISIGLFQDYTEDRLRAELRREARGLTILYAEEAERAIGAGGTTLRLSRATRRFEQASGSQIYYVGPRIFFSQGSGLRGLPEDTVRWKDGRIRTFEFTPPGAKRRFLAVSSPLRLASREPYLGAIVVAKPTAELRDRWTTLIERLLLAGLVGIAVAAALAWYLSRRITKPVEALADAANKIADGRYDIEVPRVSSRDEIGHLSARFGEMAARLQEAEELERNFLMTVSHELRTPLTAIRGHVEALREGVARDEASRNESLGVIAAEAARLERLVGDVLDLAKLDTRRFTLRREEVDMGRLLESAYSTFAEEARRRGIDYRQVIEARPVIVADGDRVLQIISNLLSNAFRWTPDGGRVELALEQENGTISVAVQDSGPGIPKDDVDRIFRPFWSRDGLGTGLGLAIARELATAHGGHILLDSEPGRGTRFQLVLPATPVDGAS